MYANELTCNILDYIDSNLNNINIDEISYIFGYEKSYIMKRFKKELNITIINYVNIIKVLNSLKYITKDNYLLKVALDSGFNSLEYYSEIFYKYMKVRPSTYYNLLYKSYLVSEEDMDKLRNSLADLYEIKNRVNVYRERRKVKQTPVMKLAITKRL